MKTTQKKLIDLHKATIGKFNCYSFDRETGIRYSAVIKADMVDALLFAVNCTARGLDVLFLSDDGCYKARLYEIRNLSKMVTYDMCINYAVSMYDNGAFRQIERQ